MDNQTIILEGSQKVSLMNLTDRPYIKILTIEFKNPKGLVENELDHTLIYIRYHEKNIKHSFIRFKFSKRKDPINPTNYKFYGLDIDEEVNLDPNKYDDVEMFADNLSLGYTIEITYN